MAALVGWVESPQSGSYTNGPRSPSRRLSPLVAWFRTQATVRGRIVTGKLRLDRTRTDIVSIVKQAVEMSMPLIEQRGHRLTLTAPDAPVYADFDIARMKQVVSNLLNNAAKFMAVGGRIDVSVAEAM